MKRSARPEIGEDSELPAQMATVESTIGNTPLVRLQRLPGTVPVGRGTVLLAKLEGNNPGGSVKDRPALSMIRRAQERGEIKPGDRLIEATSGNTGIALAMIAAMRGFRMTLIMPDNLSAEGRDHALRLQHGHDRHDHGRVALPEGKRPVDPDHRSAAVGRLADCGDPQV